MSVTPDEVLPPEKQEETTSVRQQGMHAHMIVAAESLARRTQRETLEEVAERAGISRVQLWRYMKRPEFMKMVREEVRTRVMGDRPPVYRALVNKAKKGNVAAIRTFFQLTGDLKADEKGPGAIEIVVNPAIVRTPQAALSEGGEKEAASGNGKGNEA